MTTSCPPIPAEDTNRCPTVDECHEQLLALLPRGRAWGDGGPRQGMVLWQFWRALAVVVAYANERICKLADEFFCATINETRDEWLIEYGLPDPCDPFPELCPKVAAVGGTRCDYYADIAARAGWTIDCQDIGADSCGGRVGNFIVGCDEPGGLMSPADLVIVVYLSESPAFNVADDLRPFVGCFQLGMPLGCEADLKPLYCLLDRVVHAHVRIQYVTVQ